MRGSERPFTPFGPDQNVTSTGPESDVAHIIRLFESIKPYLPGIEDDIRGMGLSERLRMDYSGSTGGVAKGELE